MPVILMMVRLDPSQPKSFALWVKATPKVSCAASYFP